MKGREHLGESCGWEDNIETDLIEDIRIWTEFTFSG
jgi:hypothetical protein